MIADTPSAPAPPLVTGTFGGEPVIKFILDFFHSLVGEAQE